MITGKRYTLPPNGLREHGRGVMTYRHYQVCNGFALKASKPMSVSTIVLRNGKRFLFERDAGPRSLYENRSSHPYNNIFHVLNPSKSFLNGA